MRYSIALLSLLLVGCLPGDSDGSHPVFDMAEASEGLRCEAVPLGFDAPGTVERLTAISDSTLVVLFRDAQRVVLADRDLSPLTRLAFERPGPNGVLDASDVAVIGDSLFIVADAPARKLKTFDRDGVLVGDHPLPFMPDRVVAVGGGVAIFPLVVPGLPSTTTYFLRDGTLTDLGIEPLDIGDPQMRTLVNMLTPTLAAGTTRLVVPHQFVAPVANVVDVGGTPPFDAREVRLPLSPDVVERAWWVPTFPYVEEELQGLVAPAIASTGGPTTGEITILTRSGAKLGEFQEKVLVRLDADFDVIAVYALPFNATHVVYLAAANRYVIMTFDEEWHRCEPLAS
jgi:hypothetical protein